MTRRLLILGLMLAACRAGTVSTVPLALSLGTYVLTNVGGKSVPLFRPGLIPGEGTTLRGAVIRLQPQSTLSSTLVIAFTDSGTVVDTVLISGTWRTHGDSVLLDYRWTHPRFADEVLTGNEVGRIDSAGITLRTFAFLTPAFFGVEGPLRFRKS